MPDLQDYEWCVQDCRRVGNSATIHDFLSGNKEVQDSNHGSMIFIIMHDIHNHARYS